MCSPFTDSERPTAEEEENRLARTDLLQLSQVCSRWHSIIMSTSRLWSTIKADTRVWAQSTLPSAALLHLLELSLHRSGELPLNLEITVDSDQFSDRGILQLLVRHSGRWRNVSLLLNPHSIDHLAGAKGNLPLLENLALHSAMNIRSQADVENVFFLAPRLKSITFTGPGWLTGASAFPWSQLRYVKIGNGDFSDISLGALPFLPPQACCCEIEVDASMITFPYELPPITSNISTLLVSLWMPHFASFNKSPLHPTKRHPSTSVEPHTFPVFRFAETELLECLVLLPLLEELRLWDCTSTEDDTAVITDNVLNQLAWRADQTNLVPRLQTLGLSSTMEFREESLWNLISSRAVRPEIGPFVVMVLYLGSQREFSPEFLAQLSELEKSGDIVFASGHA
ncbi:hypothetical protein MSAN_01644200 [Mycena sanguinolenta]|uniref:F-box domain-containing protein n=1 Tax=Mycena sanguinolenta TaxID=230812 RepID=A0A8H6XYT2_9AGAR|nr:hypothetical protein MSAN_01644200 [Mycena sanguinolenta]